MKAIKVIFHDLLSLLITFYIKKKKIKRKAVVGKRNKHVKCVPVNTSVFRCVPVYRRLGCASFFPSNGETFSSDLFSERERERYNHYRAEN